MALWHIISGRLFEAVDRELRLVNEKERVYPRKFKKYEFEITVVSNTQWAKFLLGLEASDPLGVHGGHVRFPAKTSPNNTAIILYLFCTLLNATAN